jgi:tetraacyldisaccharide 4'-kinase
MNLVRGIVGVVLRPLAALYGAITTVRNMLYDRGIARSFQSELPVISVGNVTVGGNGKTPLCLWLVERLRAVGYQPVIVSRGYGGTRRGPYRVKEGDSPLEVGDEPLLLAQRAGCPVYIARSRSAGAARVAADQAGDLIILDDGLQHRRLKRDVDIVSIFAGTEKAVTEFVAGALLPFGRFREARTAALRRASIVVISDRAVSTGDATMGAVDPRLMALMPRHVKVFRAGLEFDKVLLLSNGEEIAAQPVHALSAIANPEGFYSTLPAIGFTVLQKHSFRDHHAFTESEVRRLLERNPGTLFVCTEKDAVKLRGFPSDILDRFAECRVRLSVVPADAFVVTLQRELGKRQGQKRDAVAL